MELSENWKNRLINSVLVLGVGLLFVGLYIHFVQPTTDLSSDIVIATNKPEQAKTTMTPSPVEATAAPDHINVDVSGSVTAPGVYELSFEARLTAALDAAGGLNKNADAAWVARNLNLATKLRDGDKIYIPKKGELSSAIKYNTVLSPASPQVIPAPKVAGITTGEPGLTTPIDDQVEPSNTVSAKSPSDGFISINSATKSELDTLPGVGEITAQKIIDNRPYTRLEELKEKKAVNKSTYEKIKDKIKL